MNPKNQKPLFTLLLIFLTLFFACDGGQMSEKIISFPSIKDVPASSWERLSQMKIFFGHQSVGYNIIDGIKDLMKENPQIRLNIVETDSPSEFNASLFAHYKVGKNTDPNSKIKAFESWIVKGIGEKADIAFFKLCYVDLNTKTNIQDLFKNYKTTMSNLKGSYPETTFIHVTVPLTSEAIGIKRWLKKIKDLVKTIIGTTIYNNSNRSEFNEMLRKEYEGKASIFDLAKIESTYSDGRRIAIQKRGKTFYALVPEYTYDGGHLNETGRKKVAEQLLILLANISNSKGSRK
jgi:hypothetical protein